MDEDSLPPQPPFLTETNTNINVNIPYSFTSSLQLPSTSLLMHQQAYANNSSLLHQQNPVTQNSDQFSLENIDWESFIFSGNTTTNADQMLTSSPAVSSLANSRNNDVNNSVDGDQTNVNSCKNKRKLGGRTKKCVPPRVAFHTRSSEDILDDGYKWRKYGQKAVKHTKHPRSYYRCTHHTCNVKKQIQRHSKDNSVVVTTYEGIHNHPCEKLMETLTPILRQLQFLSRF